MPWGRGGAGNIEAAASQKISDDIEAQRVAAENAAGNRKSQTPSISSGTSPSAAQPANVNQDYAHMGRGGAGNWFSPKELVQTGEFVTSPEVVPTGQPKSQEKELIAESRHRGRGGAGNFVWSAEDEEASRKEKDEMEIELKDMVAKDVEKGLARPDRAFIRQWDE